jgi:TetR/AcrR family transcriptional regulator
MRYAALGANILYFLSAPLTRLAFGVDPLERGELAHRREVAIEYLGQTIFADREHGARVAGRVLAATPMPDHSESPANHSHNASFKENIEAGQTSAIEARHQ